MDYMQKCGKSKHLAIYEEMFMNKDIYSNLLYMLRQIAKYAPGLLCAAIIEGIIWGIIHSVTSVIYLRIIFDQIENMQPLSEILKPIGLLTVFLCVAFIFHAWYWSYYQPKKRIVLLDKMHSQLIQKAQQIRIDHYDDPEFYDNFLWSMRESDSRAISLLNEFGRMINRCIASFTMLGIILSIDATTILIIGVSLLLTALFYSKNVENYYHLRNELIRNDRKLKYVERIFYLKDYAFDLRTTKLSAVMEDLFSSAVNENIHTIQEHKRKLFWLNFFSVLIIIILIDAAVLLILSYRLIVTQTISLGDFAAVVGGVSKLFYQINDLNHMYSRYKEHGLFAGKYRSFLKYNIEIKQDLQVKKGSFDRLDLKNIWFRYQKDRPWVLKDINMEIQRGEKIAIIGDNGSGKTTLTNLIMRFYDCDKGQLLMNQNDAYSYSEQSYRDVFSVLFQDFKFFPLTIAENLLGDFFHPEDISRINSALSIFKMDAYVGTLKKGVQTEISQEFDLDGINPSVGQLCRLGLAKMLIKDRAEIIVLDEPTAPLDPVSEYELNQLLIDGLSDKTVLFVSHRLSSTKLATRIYVMEQGQIIEKGTHDELMKQNGKYAQMFQIQSSQYEKGEMEIETGV